MKDPWEQLADEQIVNPVKSRMRAAETRAKRRLEKAKSDKDYLHKEWLAWRAKQRAALIDGPYGEAAAELADFIERMEFRNGEQLITKVQTGPWVSADTDSRHEILRLISHGIIYRRELEGLPPFDDSMPFSGEEPTVFERCREILR